MGMLDNVAVKVTCGLNHLPGLYRLDTSETACHQAGVPAACGPGAGR
jgi:hypothetical protein